MKQRILAAILVSRMAVGLAGAAEPDSSNAVLLRQPGVVSAEFIFTEAPFPQCHASTIVATPIGLVAAWFGGTRERDPDVGIWVSRHLDSRWSAPIEVANGVQYTRTDGVVHRHPCWNPVLFQPKKGPLLLFYKCGPEPREWWGMLTTSTDNGATWSEPWRLPEGIIGPVKNKPIQIADGTIVCPSSTEDHGWQLHLEFTNDLGKTWTRTGPLNDATKKAAIQPSLLFHRPAEPGARGRWQMLARDHRRKGNVWSTWSNDNGHTWTELESTGLPNPSSGTDALTLADGRQLLVYNHRQRASEDAPSAGSRAFLNVAVSDDGVRWQAAVVLEDGDDEYSYPAVIQTNDGLVHFTYTWNRRRIKHVVVDPAKLKLTPIVDGHWPGDKKSNVAGQAN